ncbi:MAG: type I-G CRISPR-associated protein Cas8g1/Csx17 [Acidiferrobacteraceae bacterium]
MSMHTIHELVLEGCSPTPLGGYLKALGVLRLLDEQRPKWAARGAWREDRFVLMSTAFSGDFNADRQLVQSFFLDEYCPTPIVAPWNGGSGFYFQEGKLNERDPVTGKKKKTGVRNQPTEATKTVEKVLASTCNRFSEFRAVLQLAKSVVSECGFQEAPKEEEKRDLIQKLRGLFPDNAIVSLDAGLVLVSEKPGYAPLLGTGWNDGNLDFTNNFMQRLTELITPDIGKATDAARAWLPSALFGGAAPGMVNAAIGQFHPGSAGGPNATAGYEADSLMNPWDFVLMLEGALFFAATTTRRLEAAEPGMLAYPFTVRSSGVGNGAVGSGDEAQARAEIWMPLWKGFSSAGEIKALLTEGRATLGRRPVRDGLGFVRAIAGLGVNRGIASFQRYGFLMRSGKAYLATPLTRVEVCRNSDADLIDELESGQFLDRLRRFARDDQAPTRIRSQVRQLEDALFELAKWPNPRTLQRVITHLGVLSLLLGKSRKGREAIPPVPTLSERWVLKADDDSAEFRITASLAGLYGGMPLRPFLVPVAQDKYGGWVWNPESRLAVWGEGGFAANLGHVIARRRLETERMGQEGSPFQFSAGVASGDVAAWLAGQLDETRLAELLLGLIHARIPMHLASRSDTTALPAAYGVLKPFFTPPGLLAHFDFLPPDRSLSLPGELVAKLQAGRTQEAVDLAWRRLRAADFPLPTSPRQAPSAQCFDGPRLFAALVMPLEAAELARCLAALTRKPSSETV